MISKKVLIVSTILFLLFGFCKIYAEPVVNSSEGIFSHGEAITVHGSGFGTKNPASPLLWDDCESGVIIDKWSGYMPYQADESFNTSYHDAPFRGVSASHNHSTRFMSGGHDPDGCYPNFNTYAGPNVLVWLDSSDPINTAYVSYYHRLDPLWPDENDNFKTYRMEGGPGPYTGNGWYIQYCDLDISDPWCYHTSSTTCTMGYRCQQCENSSGMNAWGFTLNYLKTWHKEEICAKDESGGFVNIYHDNVIKWNTSNCDPSEGNDPYTITIGGYWRKLSSNECDENAFRYWDDIYIDTTFARVMLANNTNYEHATIIEPQIPSEWSNRGDSITCTVNLGRLPASGVAYLFVFDADNNHNSEGYPVNINYSEGGIGTAQLDAPTGLEIVDIEN